MARVRGIAISEVRGLCRHVIPAFRDPRWFSLSPFHGKEFLRSSEGTFRTIHICDDGTEIDDFCTFIATAPRLELNDHSKKSESGGRFDLICPNQYKTCVVIATAKWDGFKDSCSWAEYFKRALKDLGVVIFDLNLSDVTSQAIDIAINILGIFSVPTVVILGPAKQEVKRIEIARDRSKDHVLDEVKEYLMNA
ncbi:hypothetical protein ACOME3_008733 [Neoechinorhynchus agilis]